MGLSAAARQSRPRAKRAPRAGAVSVSCGMCSGTGRVVHGRATELYALITGEWQATAALASRVGISATNAANVLALLHHLGLVDRIGSGAGHSPFRWRRV